MSFTIFQVYSGIKGVDLDTTNQSWYKKQTSFRLLPLTLHHTDSADWICVIRASWSATYWRYEIFSCESRFSISVDDDFTQM